MLSLSERRRVYRQPCDRAGLPALRVHRRDHALAAEVVDSNVGGVAVEAEGAIGLVPGERLHVEAVGADGSHSRFVAEVLGAANAHGAPSRFGLRFLEPPAAPVGDARSFHRAFNRRGAWRVPLAEQDDVSLSLRVADGADTAVEGVVLRNLSATGAGLLAPATGAQALDGHERLSLALRLPGMRAPMLLAARVRNRAAGDDGLYLGVEFDPAATEGFLEKAEDIVGFVLARRRRDARA